MKTKRKLPQKLWLSLAALVILVGIVACCILATAKSGWIQQDGITQYYADYRTPLTGWQGIEGKLYYFDPETTALVTGWLELDGIRYYLSSTGAVNPGLQTIDGNRYYLEDDGAVCIGWKTLPEDTYYFLPDGTAASGWQKIDSKQYYFDSDGAMHLGWLDDGTDHYYFREDGTMAVGEVVIDDFSYFFTSKGKHVELVNAWHLMPEDYTLDLVDIEDFLIDRSCKDALQQMLNDCRAAGYGCWINNTYRSIETQQELWDERMAMWMSQGASYDEALALVGESVAVPGGSEHNLGLAADINGSEGVYDWLEENCQEYGFIMRYPDEKKELTGIIYEPWHYRYVGTELAQELTQLGLCMEEYMQMLTTN